MSSKGQTSVQTPAAARSWLATELQACERDFLDGDRMALAHAIAVCATLGKTLPKWAARAYVAGYSAIIHYRSESWESIFGPTKPKGKHLAALRKQSEKSLSIWQEILRQHEAGTPIDDQLFEEVGRANGIGKTVAKSYFAAAKQVVEIRSTGNDRGATAIREWCENRLDAARRAIDEGNAESARKVLASVRRRLAKFYGVSAKTLFKS